MGLRRQLYTTASRALTAINSVGGQHRFTTSEDTAVRRRPTRSNAYASSPSSVAQSTPPPPPQPSSLMSPPSMVGNGVPSSSPQASFRGFTEGSHEARRAFGLQVDRLIWTSAAPSTQGNHTDEAQSSAGEGLDLFSQPLPTLEELTETFNLASADLMDVCNARVGLISLAHIITSNDDAIASQVITILPDGMHSTLQSACASLVADLEARERVVAFVDACARVLQCKGLFDLIEQQETALVGEQLEQEFAPRGLVLALRSFALAASTKLLPHAAEAHDSTDEAIALLSCSSSVLTLVPTAADRLCIQKLLVPAMIVCRRLTGPDLATLLLCVSRTFDTPPSGSTTPMHGSSFLSYTAISDLKTLELEVLRRFDAAFAKYCPPLSRLYALTIDQQEAHRRQFISARRKALLTLTDVGEIASAFAILRFAGSADLSDLPAKVRQRGGALLVDASRTISEVVQSKTGHSPNNSILWNRIVDYTCDFISHDLRLGHEAEDAASAAAVEASLIDTYEGYDADPPTLNVTAGDDPAAAHKAADDTIDTTFTKADIQSICFALDCVGCSEGYDRLMSFLVEKEVLRSAIAPPTSRR